MNDEVDRIRKMYASREQAINDLEYMWHPRNSVSYAYRHVRERALIELLNKCEVSLEQSKILDIGCGNGEFIRFVVALGANPGNVFGMDLMNVRIARASQTCPPGVHLQVGDARFVSFADESFDIVSQFTVFSSVLDSEFRQAIAGQITRILKPGGLLIWYDFIRHHSKASNIRAVSDVELRHLFPDMESLGRAKLYNNLFRKLARRSWYLALFADMIPGLSHTHILTIETKS